MSSPSTLKKLQQSTLAIVTAKRQKSQLKPSASQHQQGFTLIELLVVVALIGVIAAIAAPGWLSFTQQRRVNASNDAMLRALQQAQSQAKARKLSYSVSLKASAGQVPAIAVHQGTSADIPADTSPNWQSLGQGLEIKPGQIWVGTNADATTTNKANGNINGVANANNSKITVATFDYMGALLSSPVPPDLNNNQGLIIAVASSGTNTNPPQPIPSTERCVKVSTLLGSIQSGRIDSSGGTVQCKPVS